MSGVTDKQTSCLRLFMQRLQELLDSPVTKSGRKSLGVISETIFGDKTETTVVCDGHDEDDFKSFFTTFRQFTMPKEEAVHFGDACKIVLDNCDREELKKWVRYAEARWDALLDGKPVVGFSLNGDEYTNGKLLKLWLYSGRFHTDIAKAKLWDSLPEKAQIDAALSIQALTPKLVNCLVTVGSVIRWWLDEPDAEVPTPPEAS